MQRNTSVDWRQERQDRIARQQMERTRARLQPDEEEKRGRTTRSSGEWALGIVLIVFGAFGWLVSAKYTLFGWVIGVNYALTWLGLPLHVPVPVGWFVLLMVPLGIIYSRVETRIWHRRSSALMRTPLFWLGWLIIVGTDVYSTWLGVRIVSPESWTFAQQIAANVWAALFWAAFLTFVPEWAILGGVKFIRR